MRVGLILDDLIADTSNVLKSNFYPFSKNGLVELSKSFKPSIIAKIQPYDQAKDIINLLRKRGYLINIFCDRPKNLFTVTSGWLKKHDIRFDSLVFTRRKAEVAKEMKISFFVDVDYESLISFTHYDRITFSRLVLLDKPYNVGKEHQRFIRAYSWNDIKKILLRRSI